MLNVNAVTAEPIQVNAMHLWSDKGSPITRLTIGEISIDFVGADRQENAVKFANDIIANLSNALGFTVASVIHDLTA